MVISAYCYNCEFTCLSSQVDFKLFEVRACFSHLKLHLSTLISFSLPLVEFPGHSLGTQLPSQALLPSLCCRLVWPCDWVLHREVSERVMCATSKSDSPMECACPHLVLFLSYRWEVAKAGAAPLDPGVEAACWGWAGHLASPRLLLFGLLYERKAYFHVQSLDFWILCYSS